MKVPKAVHTNGSYSGRYTDLPGAEWASTPRDWDRYFAQNKEVGYMLDKTVAKFRKATETWTGANHYKNDTTQPIDLIHASGLLTPFACASIIKYATRMARGQSKEKTQEDLLKIYHYAGFVWEDLEGSE